jgi:hypothetical protein
MKKLFAALAAGACLAAMTAQTMAAPIVDKKLGQFGLEPRFACVKWAKPWPGAKICIGHKVEFLQHSFHLVVNGPKAEEAVRKVLGEAVAAAATAAVGAGLLTPSPEPAARIGAAVAAAKAAFVGYLAARGMERLLSMYDLRIDHRTYWS